ncbi:MAG: GNAT family protein [Pseudomonadota bacterium]
MTVPILFGRRVTLRAPTPEDAAGRLALGQSPEIIRMYGVDPDAVSPLTETGARLWADSLAKHPYAWIIEHEGELLGEIRLDALDKLDRRARLAIGFFDAAKLGIGLGREAICVVVKHAFHELGLHRIGLRVLAYNTRAIRCYSACGFVEEGREREAAFVAGQWHDDVMMGLLDREARYIG